ncbi:hypothetical protein [Arthrobacter sp. NEB 688]|uniref:hypothetical protein n=1 Tax=Arthrobacter sp. NEB 688 TaxID=904039 RepID=UPI001566DE86|nr:hypothetical protein [Arthrobacter sp. NEB 688]QKE82656.1 hypothetical protein HL663_00925 [Arthrobacter sp. NEB 688]
MGRKKDGGEGKAKAAKPHSPERFGLGALFGVGMFVPAAMLVQAGNLSIDQAVLRFGLAWLAAVVGVGIVASTLHNPPARAAAPSRVPVAAPVAEMAPEPAPADPAPGTP